VPRYFIGIDNGSQSAKVTIFDAVGHAVSEGRQPLRPNHMPAPGVVEHPDDDLWTSIGQACRTAMDGFAGDVTEIVGVGLCTIRFCRALLLRDGSLAQPMLSWMDTRVAMPHRQDDDDRFGWVTSSSGYITHRMTGEFRDSAANYQGMWPIDTDTWRWTDDPDRLRACGIDRDQLFELVLPGDVLGQVTADAAAATGLPVGLPVVATANDKAVEALGSGLRDPGTLLVSLGTYIAGMTIGERNATGASRFWTNFGCIPHRYLYESEGIRRGMWTVSWYRDLLGAHGQAVADAAGLTVEEHLERGAEQVPVGSEGLLTTLDWLAPGDAPFRRGSMLGFDGRHGRHHIYRSVLEGIAMTMRQRTTAMTAELDQHVDRLVLSGGGAGSDLMVRIFADVFDLPVARPRVSNAAGLGAAMCVAVGLGEYPDFDTTVEAMVQPGTPVDPNEAAHHRYREIGEVYQSVTASTDEIFRRLAALEGRAAPAAE